MGEYRISSGESVTSSSYSKEMETAKKWLKCWNQIFFSRIIQSQIVKKEIGEYKKDG